MGGLVLKQFGLKDKYNYKYEINSVFSGGEGDGDDDDDDDDYDDDGSSSGDDNNDDDDNDDASSSSSSYHLIHLWNLSYSPNNCNYVLVCPPPCFNMIDVILKI